MQVRSDFRHPSNSKAHRSRPARHRISEPRVNASVLAHFGKLRLEPRLLGLHFRPLLRELLLPALQATAELWTMKRTARRDRAPSSQASAGTATHGVAGSVLNRRLLRLLTQLLSSYVGLN